MNAVTSYLHQEWGRLYPGRPEPRTLRCFLKTPRFRASSHVLFFVFVDDAPDPEFVVKVSRLPGDDRWVDREAANLIEVQGARAPGFDSIPRAAAYETHDGLRMLVQTALRGETMDRAYVRARPDLCVQTVAAWLSELHGATGAQVDAAEWRRVIDDPLDRLDTLCADRPPERALIRRTRETVAPLREASIPLVFEHGDLSAPNLLIDERGRVGVVDWELAIPRGLPATDLFFFLTFVAFARGRAHSRRSWLAAFRDAFFGPDAWAAGRIREYARALRLPAETLEPLFVSTWARYVAGEASRLGADDISGKGGAGELVECIASSRFRILWEYAVDHRHELHLTDEWGMAS